MKNFLVSLLAIFLCACAHMLSFLPPPYTVSQDNAKAITRFGGGNINVGPFTNTAEFDSECGITAGSVVMPGNLSFEGYIRKGLVDELVNANMYDDVAPKITLSGTVEHLSFFSRREIYTSTWKIGLRITSSNGQSVSVTEHYDFDAGPGSRADCQRIADAYMPAVQKILGKFINSPEFKSLIRP